MGGDRERCSRDSPFPYGHRCCIMTHFTAASHSSPRPIFSGLTRHDREQGIVISPTRKRNYSPRGKRALPASHATGSESPPASRSSVVRDVIALKGAAFLARTRACSYCFDGGLPPGGTNLRVGGPSLYLFAPTIFLLPQTERPRGQR